MRYQPIPCRVTGQTPLFSSQMQEWANQFWDEQGIECYCLDAPLYIPTGVTKESVGTGQAVSQTRPGTYGY